MENFIMIFMFFLSLSILIVLHEFGHYLPAKWFKTRVEKFYLFFNPYFSLFKKQIGETEYGVGWLPLGGYVKIAGMIDESMDKEQLKQDPQPWEFRSKPAWQRLIIMVGGVTVNFLLGFFIFSMIIWKDGKEFIPTRELTYGIAVDSFTYAMGFRDGDIITKVGQTELEQFDRRKIIKKILLDNERTLNVIRNEQPLQITIEENFAKELVKPTIKDFSLWSIRVPAIVNRVLEKGAAEKAGIKKGDRMLAINGIPASYQHEFADKIKGRVNESISLDVLRGQDTLQFSLQTNEVGHIGIGWEPINAILKTDKKTFGLGASLVEGTMQGVTLLKDYWKSIGQMFTGNVKAKDSLGGFISITKQFPTTWDWTAFWNLTAMLSIILAFMNLLPIPALDGGYVVFLIIEVVTGKKVDDRIVEKATIVGFFLLIALLIYANGLDVFRLFN